MKKLGLSLAMAIAAVGAAHSADLPTTKPAPAPPPENCFSSLWAYMNSTAADCPLTYGPFTAYLTLDWGVGWESHGAGYNAAYNNGVSNIVTKQSGLHSEWLQTPNGINQSVVGIKMSQPIAYGWSIVGTAEMGFNPYWGYLADAQRSQVQNNGKALTLQNANADSSRTGQWDNSQGFIGISNPTYGKLVAGRVNTLSLDSLISYDPMSSAYAFSPFGYSGSFAGFGDTELARADGTAVKYQVSYMNFRAGGLAQWGGYDQGNGSTSLWQGQVGGDFNLFGGTPYAGALSLDFLGDYAQNAVNLSTFTGTCATLTSGPFKGQTACTSGIPEFYSNTDLKATLSNNTGFMALAKYKWGPVAISGGYTWLTLSDPSDTFPDGFKTIGGWNVPGTIPSTFPRASKFWPTQWISYTTYANARIAPFWFFGLKYSVTPQLDVSGAFYYQSQNDYNSSTTPCAPANTTFVEPNGYKFTVTRLNNSACAGSQDFLSFLVDYRPVKRVDLYAGVMLSNVYGGFANGYQVTQTVNPTAGLRIKF